MSRWLGFVILALLSVIAGPVWAEQAPATAALAQTEFPPASGSGRVVIVLAGKRGPAYYADFARRIAGLGYDAELFAGADILTRDGQGGAHFEETIRQALASPHAIAGKIGVIGLSEGGGAALAYATRAVNSVAVVVAYYPETAFLLRPRASIPTFAGAFGVPVVAFAGAEDTYLNCCQLTTIRSIEETAKGLGRSFDLTVYPDAGHDFIKGAEVRPADAEDAWKRTIAALQRYLGT